MTPNFTPPNFTPTWASRFHELPRALEFNTDCGAFLAERRATLGTEDGGLFNFYDHKLQTGDILSAYDVRLAHHCATTLSHYDAVVEIGCGAGQLPFLLAVLGLRSVGFEYDRRRFQCASDMRLALAQKYPEIAERVTLYHAAFPAPLPGLDKARCVAIANCLILTHTPEQGLAIVRELGAYGLAIIDVTRFLDYRRTDDKRQDLFDLLAREGFDAPVLLGPPELWDGEFVALVKPKTGAAGRLTRLSDRLSRLFKSSADK